MSEKRYSKCTGESDNPQQSTIFTFFKKRVHDKNENVDELRATLGFAGLGSGVFSSDGTSEKMHIDENDEENIEPSGLNSVKKRGRNTIIEDEEMDIDIPQKFSKSLNGVHLLRKYANNPHNNFEMENNTEFENKFKLQDVEPDSNTFSKTHVPKVQPTQLEQQYLRIKAEYNDCILMMEVGYRYRFFAEDALLAAKELNIVAYLDHTLYTASIPVHRLNVHVHRLVKNGHKVGLIQQMETAALKSISTNKIGPFERKLTKIYSRATFVDDFGSSNSLTDEETVDDLKYSGNSGYMYFINESNETSADKKKSNRISIVAVSPSIGNVVFDEFENDPIYDALQTRLLHLTPVEIILSKDMISKSTLNYLKTNFSSSPVDGLPIRIEFNESVYDNDKEAAKNFIFNEFKHIISETDGSQDDKDEVLNKKTDIISNMTYGITICLSAMIKHLLKFGLNRIMIIDNNYTHFMSDYNMMILDSDTISSLELCNNVSSKNIKSNSLLDILDCTSTPMGKRTLKQWLVNPLTDMEKIILRHNAVDELINKVNQPEIINIKHIFSTLPDLLKSSCRIFYLRSCPSDLYFTVSAFKKLSLLYSNIPTNYFRSPLIIQSISSFSKITSSVEKILSALNHHVARNNEIINLLVDVHSYPLIVQYNNDMKDIVSDLNNYLEGLKEKLNWGKFAYNEVSGISYLIEIPISQVSKVPLDWIKISQTKTCARFHTPFIINCLKKIDVCKEKLQLESKKAFTELLNSIAIKDNSLFKNVSNNVGIIDCLISFATSAITLNLIKPEISPSLLIEARNCRNIVVETSQDTYTPNDILINPKNRVLLITGPNMGGKSCYIKQIAILVVMCQMGSFVPAEYAKLSIFTSILTRMGASDDIMKGQSTFMKELFQTSKIIKSQNDRSLVILDELGRGTSTHDGTAIAHATLSHFIKNTNCVTLFITHITTLGELKNTYSNDLHCYHMDFIQEGNSPDSITFLYKLVEGIANKSYGLNVARLAGIPHHVVENALAISNCMEVETHKKVISSKLRRKLDFLKIFLTNELNAPLKTLISSLVNKKE